MYSQIFSRFTSRLLFLIAIAGLTILSVAFFATEGAKAQTIDFTDNASAVIPFLTEGGVTVTGSDQIAITNGSGIGIIGDISTGIDPGETMSFVFDNPVTDVSISNFRTNDTDGGGLSLVATIEAFDNNDMSLGSETTAIDPTPLLPGGYSSNPIDVSDILGIGSFSRFDITMTQDGILIAAISFEEAEEEPDDPVVAGPVNIPTLGEWGMIGMTSGLLLFGIFFAMKRHQDANKVSL